MPNFPIVDNFNFWLKCHFPREAFHGHPKSPALLRYHLKVGFFPPSLWSSPAENGCDLFSFLLVHLFIVSPPACDLDLSFSDFLCCSPMPDTVWLRGSPQTDLWSAKWECDHWKIQFFLPGLRICPSKPRRANQDSRRVVTWTGKITQKGAWPFQGQQETRGGNYLFNRYSAILVSGLKSPLPPK